MGRPEHIVGMPEATLLFSLSIIFGPESLSRLLSFLVYDVLLFCAHSQVLNSYLVHTRATNHLGTKSFSP